MAPTLAGVAFLVGFAIAILAMMAAFEKRNIFWNILTVAYGIAAGTIDAYAKARPFDYFAVSIFITALLFLSWLTVKFQIK